MSKRGIIRHRETGEYYAGAGRWAHVAAEAVSFENLSDAMVEAQKYGIHDCCEYMVSLPESPDLSVSLPI
jgi:hypothetical protein